MELLLQKDCKAVVIITVLQICHYLAGMLKMEMFAHNASLNLQMCTKSCTLDINHFLLKAKWIIPVTFKPRLANISVAK